MSEKGPMFRQLSAYLKLLNEKDAEIARLREALKAYSRHCCSECSMYVEKELGPNFRRLWKEPLDAAKDADNGK